MWLLKPSHKHIGQDTLSEYLDGRLRGRDLERVEQRLGDCDACRLELEELQTTVAMIRLLPMETPRRSFVMSAPPIESARSRTAPARRVPNWVYAGATSVAALALAITVSVDATGGLSPDPLRRDVAATAQAPALEQVTNLAEGAAESTADTGDAEAGPPAVAAAVPDTLSPELTGREGAEPSEGTALEAAAAPMPTPAPASAALTVPGEPEAGTGGDAGPEPAPSPTPDPVTLSQAMQNELAAGDAGGAGASAPPSATPAPLPPAEASGQDSEATFTESTSTESTQIKPAPTSAVPEDGRFLEAKSATGAAGPPDEDQTAESATTETPTQVSESNEPALFGQDGSKTSAWWRVLEVAAGVLAVVFLARLAIRWLAGRRNLA